MYGSILPGLFLAIKPSNPDGVQARSERVAESLRDLHRVGSPATVKRRLAMVERTDADEVMVTTMTYAHADRVRSYELLASAYALPKA